MLKKLMQRLFNCSEEPEEYEDLSEEQAEEYGHAVSDVKPGRVKLMTLKYLERDVDELDQYFCPRCNRFLFSADRASKGLIVAECKKCRHDIAIELTDKRHEAGFR